jgi:uncharacterized protein (DUF1501 family)
MKPSLTTASLTRRSLLRRGAWLSAAFGGASVGALTLAPRMAGAADYRALVAVSLTGGNDGLNTVVPTDAAGYAQYASVRASLALPRSSLVPLTGTDFGLHPALAALAPAWQAGQLAPVFNVGPLSRPMRKSQLLSALAGGDASVVPDSLFSHADQQILWENAVTHTQERTGWGGRAMDAVGGGAPVISLGGNARFGLSSRLTPLVLPGPGAELGAFGLREADLSWAPFATRKTVLDAMYADTGDGDLVEVFRRMQRDAFDVTRRLSGLVQVRPGQIAALNSVDALFAPVIATGLGSQLYQIAKLIIARDALPGTRQIFCAELNGFDTHGAQVVAGQPTAGTHARLLKELGDALAAFQAAMDAVGLGAQVTSFTLSDFGRTFAPNLSLGTDHGWGNHHLVLGGAVRGGRSYGQALDMVLGSADDIGSEPATQQGRWLPTTSVSQYAATLLAWFGLDDAALSAALPQWPAFAGVRPAFL